jgi:hypothetical protein
MTIQETEVFNQYFMNEAPKQKTDVLPLSEDYYNATIKDIIAWRERNSFHTPNDKKSNEFNNKIQFIFEIENQTVMINGEEVSRLVYDWLKVGDTQRFGLESNLYKKFTRYVFPEAYKILFVKEPTTEVVIKDCVLNEKQSVIAWIGNTKGVKKLNGMPVKLNIEIDSKKNKNTVVSIKQR